jgi:hypothetical protein
LSKLETKVQAQGSSPYGPHCDCCTSRVCPLAPPPRGTSTARLEGAWQTPLRWVRGLRELLLSAEIEFYPSYALFKERASRCGRREKLVWSWTGSNRRHPACKAGALPTELQPRNLVLRKVGGTGWRRSPAPPAGGRVVGLGGLEPPTSRLSGARSSQLSYRPKAVLRKNVVSTSRTALHI